MVDNVGGYVDIPIPLYAKRLINAFRPPINGESEYYVTAHDTFPEYIIDSGLNLHAILGKYRDYIRRRGFRAFDTKQLKEGAWHYSLDGFINFFIERLGGDTFVETINDKRIYTYIILTNFERPSRRRRKIASPSA